MSIHAMAWAKKQQTGSPVLKLVLLTVADYADENGFAWPSQVTLARETELSDRTVRRSLAELEAHRFLTRKSRPPLPSGMLQTDMISLSLGSSGHAVRRASRTRRPADTQSRPADCVSGKQSRNTPYQGDQLKEEERTTTSQEEPLGQPDQHLDEEVTA